MGEDSQHLVGFTSTGLLFKINLEQQGLKNLRQVCKDDTITAIAIEKQTVARNYAQDLYFYDYNKEMHKANYTDSG